MKILPVYTYDHPVLRKKLRQVDEITDELVALALDMHTTMHNAEGIGLAANQVGRDMSICVVDLRGVDGYENTEALTMINPVVEAVSEEE
jgi:peptide deformylase